MAPAWSHSLLGRGHLYDHGQANEIRCAICSTTSS
ncbi:MAG: hypothetical protein F2611_01480, partial [Actinobacteria bacterium]|nr:hypothetical protein [Actinomycetota bacterium]